MKVAGVIIQEKFIEKNTENDFCANYKGHNIEISTKHGFGKPKYPHLKRFNIDVRDKHGMMCVDTYKDFHNIKDAIRYALEGAMLIQPNTKQP